ncbi:hypothetical protein STEG23_018999 [Scotinomys teguina]
MSGPPHQATDTTHYRNDPDTIQNTEHKANVEYHCLCHLHIFLDRVSSHIPTDQVILYPSVVFDAVED